MFRFGGYCSKFLLLVVAIGVFGYSFAASALSSMPSDAFNGDLLAGELPYSLDSSGNITLKLKKNSGLAKVELVIPDEHAISFVAIRPAEGCWNYEEPKKIGFSYVDACSNSFKWTSESLHVGAGGGKRSAEDEMKVSIEDGHTKLLDAHDNLREYFICPTNFKKNDKSQQGGYLANFTLSGNFDCDVSVRFRSEYKILQPAVEQTIDAPSALLLWHMIAIGISCFIVAGSLILAIIFICCKYVCRPKHVLPTASTANPSASVAVTCLPDVKVVKPTATTQPPTVSGDLKQKLVPIPPPTVSKDLKQGQKPASIPPPLVPAKEKDLPEVHSDKLLAMDDGDDIRLAPNTIEITSLEKKRRKNRRMLKAVDEDEMSAALKLSSKK